MTMPLREVAFVTRILTHYRVPFHERVRDLLEARGIRYRLLHGQPGEAEAAKGDLASLPWAETFPNLPLLGRERLVWQPIGKRTSKSGLVIIGQENRLLANYWLQMTRGPRRRIALFGHGRNFQSRNPGGPAERWKRFWATKCDWWFAYTDATRRHIESLGFPPERITVFQNAIDTTALRRQAESLSAQDVAAAVAALGMKGTNVGIFVGGLYPDKRLEFLVEAAERVRARIPDFELLVVGGGPDLPKLRALALARSWICVAGPRFGREKAALMRAAKLFLMPGLAGLAVLDAGAMGLPVVTTAFPWHSPEIAYLEHGRNGVIVQDWKNPDAYADAIVDLMLSNSLRKKISVAGRAIIQDINVEKMAQRFVNGIHLALQED